jgi:hypothetical protein
VKPLIILDLGMFRAIFSTVRSAVALMSQGRRAFENQSAFLAIRRVFADVCGFSFVEGIAWQLFVAGGLGLWMKK